MAVPIDLKGNFLLSVGMVALMGQVLMVGMTPLVFIGFTAFCNVQNNKQNDKSQLQNVKIGSLLYSPII